MPQISTSPSYSDIAKGFVDNLANIATARAGSAAGVTTSTPAQNLNTNPIAKITASPWFVPAAVGTAILTALLVAGRFLRPRR